MSNSRVRKEVIGSGQFLHGDCLELMREMPDVSVDMVVTSPPYDNLRTYNGMPPFTFDVFRPIADQLARVLKPGGVIVWNVADATVNGSETGSSFRQALYFKDECGLNLHDTMIWQKTDYPPQTKVGMRYTNSFEYMFVLSKGKPATFNPIHVPTLNAGAKKETTTQRDADGTSRLKRVHARKGRVVNDTKPLSSVWTFAKQGAGAVHPAQYPLKLPVDHILSWSNPGDLVLDPSVVPAPRPSQPRMPVVAGRAWNATRHIMKRRVSVSQVT